MAETRNKLEKDQAYAGVEWIAIGMAIGIAMGMAIGALFFDNIGMGLGIGIGLGVSFGIAFMILAAELKKSKTDDTKPAVVSESSANPPADN